MMDKFAVDLEKVLDDFEYNEGREEIGPPTVKSCMQISQRSALNPASLYRRPAFEPINLSDADFAAAAIPPSPKYLGTRLHTSKDLPVTDSNDESDQPESGMSEAPDLLDSNHRDEPNQLPDITSVKTGTLEPDPAEPSSDLDLIKPHVSSDLPPVVAVDAVMEDLVELEVQPARFNYEETVSDTELEAYLDNIYAEAENDGGEPESDEQPLIKQLDDEDVSEETAQVETESTELAAPSIDSCDTSDECEPCLEQSEESEDLTVESIPVEPPPVPEEPQIENQVNENLENIKRSTIETNLEDEEPRIRPNQLDLDQLASPSAPDTPSLSSVSSDAQPEPSPVLESDESPTPTNDVGVEATLHEEAQQPLGDFPPFWVPDEVTDFCMQCHDKFTVLRRRHHCRACGLVLCSKCCNLKTRLRYLKMAEARVCQPCFGILTSASVESPEKVVEKSRYELGRQPNPNNPMEYCSTVPPLQQASTSANQPPPSVLVPSGVLKREGRAKSEVPKQVMFSDGIRPGGDLTELDLPPESRIVQRKGGRRLATPPGTKNHGIVCKRPLDSTTQSFIPSNSTGLPPLANNDCGQLTFLDDVPSITDEPVKFAVNNNLFVLVKRVKLECCVNRECWSACSEGLANVGQDEVAVVLECIPDELLPPQDLFHFYNTLYLEGSKGSTVSELSFTPSFSNSMLGSKDHGGFLYIRPTFQCTTNLLLPRLPYVFAVLVHRWETPWARLFPLRLVLRLGAEYRYYPCPLFSVRNRPPLYTDIGHTVMKILVDFRKYSYTLATVRGLLIHMEDRQTTILFPRNRYDQVLRALNNSNDSVLAFGANLSLSADSHLVCIQGTKDENQYHTQAINIHSKPRRVTGASFVVFNGALKTEGLSGKTSIVEDGLMVQLPSERMTSLRTALRDMVDFTISCGPNDDETVYLRWTADDTGFNIGVKSVIDNTPLDGVPSIRVHNGTDYGVARIIRWTEVFIIKSDEGSKTTDPLDISRVSESLARATCLALVQDLESLVKNNLNIIGVRATIHPENVGYEAGSNGEKLPQCYMNRLDEELIGVLTQAAAVSQTSPVVLELVFRIINHP